MVNLTFILSLIILSFSAFGAEAPSYSYKWVTTPLIKKVTPVGTVESKVLIRKVVVGDTTFTVGNISYLKFPKPKNKKPEAMKDVAQQIKKAMGFSKWIERKQGEAFVYETEWKGRFVRIYLRDHGESYSYSVAMIRMVYASKSALEAELIQRSFAKVLTTKYEWIEGMVTSVKSMIISDAHAFKPYTQCADDPASCISQESSDRAEAIEEKTQDRVEDVREDAPRSNQGGSGSNGLIDQITGQIGGDSKDFSKGVTAITKEMEKANQSIKDVNKLGNKFLKESKDWRKDLGKVSKQMDEGLDIADRGMDAVEYLLEGSNAAILVGSSIATGTLASIAISTAADVIVGAGKMLSDMIVEAITHEKENTLVLERFRAAREVWEQRKTAAAQFETMIDGLVTLKMLEKDTGKSREELIIEMMAMKEVNKDKIDALINERKEASLRGDMSCALDKAREQVKLEKWATELMTVTSLLEKSSKEDEVCDQIMSQVKKLIQSEADLEKARSDISAGRKLWQDKFFEEQNQVTYGFERAKKERDLVAQAQKNQAHKSASTAKDIVEKDRQVYIEKCLAKKAEGFQQMPFVGPLFSFEVRNLCIQEFEKNLGSAAESIANNADMTLKRRLANAQDVAKEESDDILLQPNSKVQTAEFLTYDKWFTEILAEQKCSNSIQLCPEGSIKRRLKRILATQGKIANLCPNMDASISE